MADNEKTSAEVASIASEILRMESKPYIMSDELWEKIKTLAGSALTQTADKEPKPARRIGRYESTTIKPFGASNPLPSVGLFSKIFKDIKNDKDKK